MIEKYGFHREMVCDSCHDGFGTTYSADDFEIMVRDAKEAGWKIVKENAWWFHYCNVCASNPPTDRKKSHKQ